MVFYRRGEWAKALNEFRTARRLSGSHHLLPLMADTERGLGRPERALELGTSAEARLLGAQEQVELAIVISGARVDMGQTGAAVLHVQDLAQRSTGKEPWAPRLRYAYAAALRADGREGEALEWFARAAEVDVLHETDAAELLGHDPEPVVIDLGGDEPEDGPQEGGGFQERRL